jgi:hypothetical protein
VAPILSTKVLLYAANEVPNKESRFRVTCEGDDPDPNVTAILTP